MTSSLIGRRPDQVPVCGMLGELAFMDRKSLVPSLTRLERSENAILGINDCSRWFDLSGTFTQTLERSATLGSSWHAYVRNSGTGDITLAANGSETIDLLNSFIMYPGEARLLVSDGAALHSIVLSGFTKIFTESATFVQPPGYKRFPGMIVGDGNSGQRTNNTAVASAGGGGGGCMAFDILASAVGATEAVTIGVGGAAVTGVGGGNLGTGSSFGSLITVFPGTVAQYGGAVGITAAFTDGVGMGFAATGSATAATGTDTVYAGTNASTNASTASGSSIFGAAAGGSVDASGNLRAAGTSQFGGDGGAASISGNGVDGEAPGGGGGATQTGTRSGAGARGELRISGVV